MAPKARAAGRAVLVDYAHVVGWPVNEGGLAVDELAIHRTEIAAVAGDGTVVAHHEVIALRDHDLRHGATIAIAPGHVRLFDALAVHVDPAIVDAQGVAGKRDDALDIALLRVARIVKHHHVAA